MDGNIKHLHEIYTCWIKILLKLGKEMGGGAEN